MTQLAPTTMRNIALELAAAGWPVFPLLVSGKDPATTHGHLDATTDSDQIRQQWRDGALKNVGISCGPAGLYVIDIDMNPWKGKVGAATWSALVAEHGAVRTYAVRTWSGGVHLYYRMPPGMDLRNTTGKIGPDVDTRGAGGFVVAAGSRVVQEGHTGWYEVMDDIEIAPLPDWIIEIVRKAPPRAAPTGVVAAQAQVLTRMATLQDELRDAPLGTGNDTAARVAFKAGQYVGAAQIMRDDAVRLLLDAVAGWSWAQERDADKMTATIEGQVDAGAGSPRAWVATRDPFAAVPPLPDPQPAPVPQESTEGVGDDVPLKPVSNWATDSGQGEFLRDQMPGVRYADNVGWFDWDGTRYKPVTENFVATKVNTFYLERFRSFIKRYMDSMKEDDNATAKSYKAFMSASRLSAILKQFSRTTGVRVDADELDSHPDLLNTPIGIVHLPTGKIGKHDPKFLMTKITKGSYRPGFTHPDWTKAQEALPPEVAEFMQVRLGQALTGYMPNSHDCIVATGSGGNGKSLWFTDGAVLAVGDYAYAPKADLISSGKRTPGAADEDRAGLRGVRLALVEEVPEGRSLSTNAIKAVVGTSLITARFLFGHDFRFHATHSLFITTNFILSVAETDEGSWRRLCKVDFPYSFVADPKDEGQKKGDTGLEQRIRESKTGQHDAVLTWMIEGAMRYYVQPTLINEEHRPKAVADETLAWRKTADRLLSFWDDRIVADPTRFVAKSDLYDEFVRWLSSGGHPAWTQETFFTRLRTHKVYRAARVGTAKQTTTGGGLSRPPLPRPAGMAWSSTSWPSIPARANVFKGIRFVTEDED